MRQYHSCCNRKGTSTGHARSKSTVSTHCATGLCKKILPRSESMLCAKQGIDACIEDKGMGVWSTGKFKLKV